MGQPIERGRMLALVLGVLLVAALAYGALAKAGPSTGGCSPRAYGGCYGGGHYGGGYGGSYGGGSYGGGTYGSPGPGTNSNPGTTDTTTTPTTTPAPITSAAFIAQLKLALKLKGFLNLSDLLHKGIVLNIVCNEPCTIDGSLLIPRSLASKLHIARSRQIKIASGHAKTKKAGKVKLRLRTKAHTARALRHTRRVKGTLQIVARGKNGHKKTIKRTVTLKKK
jgi:hypothetical protein